PPRSTPFPYTTLFRSRTDAGVHARGQVVTLDVPVAAIDALARRDRRGPGDGFRRLRDALNALVGPSVVVTAVSPAADDFDARFRSEEHTSELQSRENL